MNDIICRATAGTLESSDVFVTLEPHDGLQIDIDSVVKNQFGEEILRTVVDVLSELNVRNAKLSIVDRGALDCVIRARVDTAVLRGKGE